MKRTRLILALSMVMGAWTPCAFAEGEISGVIGGLLGGSLTLGTDLSTETSFDNAILYGVRGGWYGGRFGIEGSLTRSPTGLKGQAFGGLLEGETPTTYVEGNFLLLFLTGNVSPFVTGGAGFHRIQVQLNDLFSLTDIDKFGYSFGGGVKANFDQVTIRFDVRDHLTRLRSEDFGILAAIAESAGLDLSQNLHNVELSFGLGVRF
jgi:hypothetical protein